MENKKKYFKPKAITLAQQAALIEIKYPSFDCKLTLQKGLIIKGTIKPTHLSNDYTIQIIYTIGKMPSIDILNPVLEANGKKIPHVYKGNKLCLFYPKNREWTKYDYIADTIIPWASLWLYYYEVWKITGEWLGEGKHPSGNEMTNYNVYVN